MTMDKVEKGLSARGDPPKQQSPSPIVKFIYVLNLCINLCV